MVHGFGYRVGSETDAADNEHRTGRIGNAGELDSGEREDHLRLRAFGAAD